MDVLQPLKAVGNIRDLLDSGKIEGPYGAEVRAQSISVTIQRSGETLSAAVTGLADKTHRLWLHLGDRSERQIIPEIWPPFVEGIPLPGRRFEWVGRIDSWDAARRQLHSRTR
jgi:hypothetical protein